MSRAIQSTRRCWWREAHAECWLRQRPSCCVACSYLQCVGVVRQLNGVSCEGQRHLMALFLQIKLRKARI